MCCIGSAWNNRKAAERQRCPSAAFIAFGRLPILDEIGQGGADEGREIGGGELELKTATARTDVDVWVLGAGLVNVGREGFLHADGRASTADIARGGEQLFHW